MNNLIKDIENTTKHSFSQSTFRLEERGNGIYAISGDYLTEAINNWNNQQELINVLKWFDDFWLFLEIRFIKVNNEYKSWKKDKRDEFLNILTQQFIKFEQDFYQTFVTLSVFQGDDSDKVKTQLFRAEWDSFEENKVHPQPHWHIYPDKYGLKIAEDFETFIDSQKEAGFVEFVKPASIGKIIDLRKFHFAMNGDWIKENRHIHSIENDETLLKWLSGILGHIKEQLEYTK